MISGWNYYNHAIIPSTQLHELPDVKQLSMRECWRGWEGTPLLARWTTDFDCDHETLWWNIIKDTPFDINSIKSKRRYEIKKGDNNYTVKLIDYSKYRNDLFEVYMASSESFPEYKRDSFNKTNFEKTFENMENGYIFGAFSNTDGNLKGYAQLRKNGRYIGFNALRCDTNEERNNINFALVHQVLVFFADDLLKGCYIDDGARVVSHTTTHFQDFLIKYFEFRKAYSVMHIKYRFPFGIIVTLLYPFRNLFKGRDNRLCNLISGVLLQQEIVRSNKSGRKNV